MSEELPKKPRLGSQQKSILQKVKMGVPLCVQYGRGKDKFYYVDGTTVNCKSAETLLQGGYLSPEADGLIPGMGQSLRLSQKGIEAISI